MAQRVTQVVVETGVIPTSANERVTQQVVEVGIVPTSSNVRVTQQVVEVATIVPRTNAFTILQDTSLNPLGNELIVSGSTAETVVARCDLSVEPNGVMIQVDWNLWTSSNAPGIAKNVTLRVRRSGVAGTVLASTSFGYGADSAVGHERQWASSYNDATPTDGRYVLTVQVTGQAVPVYADTREFSLSTLALQSSWTGSVGNNTTSPTGNVLVVTGTTETLLPGCDLVLTSYYGRISWDIWTSQNYFGQTKTATLRLRRDSLTGPVVYSSSFTASADATGGHSDRQTGSVVARGTGRYILTIQSTAAVSVPVYSDTRTYSITQLASPIVADASIAGSVSGSVVSSAAIRREQTGSSTLDAWLALRITTSSASLSSDAVIVRERVASLGADARVLREAAGSLVADASIVDALKWGPWSETESNPNTLVTGSFPAGAIIGSQISASITSLSIVRRTQAASLTADARIFQAQTGSFTAAAWTVRRPTGSFTADAIDKRTMSGTVGADANIAGTFSVVTGSFAANAIIQRTWNGTSWPSLVLAGGTPSVWWRLTEDTGNYADSGTTNAPLTSVVNATRGVAGITDIGMRLAGTGYASSGSFAYSLSSANIFTVEVWIYLDSLVAVRRGILGSTTTGTFNMELTAAHQVAVWLPAGYVAVSSATVPAGWSHIVYARVGTGGSTHRFYINGVQSGLSQNQTTNFVNNASVKYLGVNSPGVSPFTGVIDEVVVYNRALTAAEVASHFRLGGLPVDAVILRAQSKTFIANATIINPRVFGTFPANATRRRVFTSTTTARALLRTTPTGTFLASAEIGNPIVVGSVPADAVIGWQQTAAFTAGATFGQAQSGAITSDAVLLDAYRRTASFSADAWMYRYVIGTLGANARLFARTEASFTADASITSGGSFTTAATFYGHQSASFSASAWIYVPRTYVVPGDPGSGYVFANPTPIAKIVVGGIDITDDVMFQTASFTSAVNGFPGACSFRVRDTLHSHVFVSGAETYLEIDGKRRWGGYITQVARGFAFPYDDTTDETSVARFFTLTGVDYNILFTKRVLFDKANPTNVAFKEWPVDTAADTVIRYIFDHYTTLADDGCVYDSVTNAGTINPDKRGSVGGPGYTFGDAMTDLNRLINAVWYFDAFKNLHFASADDRDNPIGLSDHPGANEVGFRDASFLADGTKLANDVFVWGAGTGSRRIAFAHAESGPSQNAHGRWQYAEFTTQMYHQWAVDERASSILNGNDQSLRGWKNDRDAWTLTIFDTRFSLGHKVLVTSDAFGLSDVYPIRKTTITFPTPWDVQTELLLSHELDDPWNFYEFWFPKFQTVTPTTVPPPIIDPPPPPPDPKCDLGITDTFSRVMQGPLQVDGEFGMSDYGVKWYSENIAGWGSPYIGYMWVEDGAGKMYTRNRPEGGGWNETYDAAFVELAIPVPPDPNIDYSYRVRFVKQCLLTYDEAQYGSPYGWFDLGVWSGWYTQSPVSKWETSATFWFSHYVDDLPSMTYELFACHGDYNKRVISAETAIVCDPTKWYNVRIQQTYKVEARLKVWEDGTTEPSAWNQTVDLSGQDSPDVLPLPPGKATWAAYAYLDNSYDTMETGTPGTPLEEREVWIDDLDIPWARAHWAVGFEDFNRTVAEGSWGVATPASLVWDDFYTIGGTIVGGSVADGIGLVTHTTTGRYMLKWIGDPDGGSPFNRVEFTMTLSFLLTARGPDSLAQGGDRVLDGFGAIFQNINGDVCRWQLVDEYWEDPGFAGTPTPPNMLTVDLGDPEVNVPNLVNVWYSLKFNRDASGTRIKVWQTGTAEPTAWTAEVLAPQTEIPDGFLFFSQQLVGSNSGFAQIKKFGPIDFSYPGAPSAGGACPPRMAQTVIDDFDNRSITTPSTTWGTASSGYSWYNPASYAAFAVTGGAGTISKLAGSSVYSNRLGANVSVYPSVLSDTGTVFVRFLTNTVAGDSYLRIGNEEQMSGAGAGYEVVVHISTAAGSVGITGGTSTGKTDWVANTWYTLEIQHTGRAVMARAYAGTAPNWMASADVGGFFPWASLAQPYFQVQAELPTTGQVMYFDPITFDGTTIPGQTLPPTLPVDGGSSSNQQPSSAGTDFYVGVRFVPNSTRVWRDGQFQRPGIDYTEYPTLGKIVMDTAVQPDETLRIEFYAAGSL
jgi:hypothetical protein